MAKKKPVKAVDDPFANQPPLIDISNRARVLRSFTPGGAKKLVKAIDAIAVCRSHNDLLRFLPQHEHEYGCYSKVCGQSAKLLDELAILIYKHLPEVTSPPLVFARLRPTFQYDDKATDWTAFENEMLRIEDAALVKHLAANPEPVKEPIVPAALDMAKQATPPQKAAALYLEAKGAGSEQTQKAFLNDFNRRKRDKVKYGSFKNAISDIRQKVKCEGSKKGSKPR